jgi:hypothetical protein
VSREDLEGQFESLLSRMNPTAELLARLPELAANQWQERKARIAIDAKSLNNRLANQRTLNQKAIMAKLNDKMSAEDFDTVKTTITEEVHRIESEISALDSERNTMEDFIKQAQVQAVVVLGA